MGWATARVRIIAAMISILVVASFATTGVPRRAARAGPRPPNIIVIVTDDQRFETNAGDRPVIPQIQQLIGDRGLTFDQAIVSNPLCCPSRASLLLGAYSHTTGVYTNTYRENQPFGAWSAFVSTGDEQVTIARALHQTGYRTALFGKYFNNFTGTQAPVGWDRFATFLREGDGGAYYDYRLLVDGPAGPDVVPYEDLPTDYSTFVFQQMALDFLRAVPADQPFLLYLTPYAPHGNITPGPHDVGTWSNLKPRMRANFNEGERSATSPRTSASTGSFHPSARSGGSRGRTRRSPRWIARSPTWCRCSGIVG